MWHSILSIQSGAANKISVGLEISIDMIYNDNIKERPPTKWKPN